MGSEHMPQMHTEDERPRLRWNAWMAVLELER